MKKQLNGLGKVSRGIGHKASGGLEEPLNQLIVTQAYTIEREELAVRAE